MKTNEHTTGNIKAPVELRTTESALLELSQELGISESDMGGKVTFEGKDPYVASKHHLGDSTATLLALFGMELAAIWKHRTGKGQDVKVNARNAMCNLAAIMYAKQNGVTPPYDDSGMVETTDFFRCKDGRWVFIVCSLPHLRQLACEVLDCQATKEEFVERCMQWNAAELEETMAAVGAACAMVRTREEWFASDRWRTRRLGRAAQDLDPCPFLVQLALSDQLLRNMQETTMSPRVPATVMVATVLIVISLAMLFRWHIVSSSIGVHRLDRWTGKVEFCSQPDGKIICQ